MDSATAPQARNTKVRHGSAGETRRDLIPSELQPKLWAYLGGIGKNHNIPVLIAGGIANHVHMLIVLPVDVPIAKAVQIFKANRRAGYRNTRLSSRGRRATGRSA